MIEVVILQALNERLPSGVAAYTEEKDAEGELYVIMEKTGSQMVNRVSHATFAVQSYAGTLYEAAELNEKVREIMDSLPLQDSISKVTLQSDYSYTDTEKKNYRYQGIYEVVYVDYD